MTMYDLQNNLAEVFAISPKTIANSGSPENLVSASIDLQFFNSAKVSMYLGEIDELGGSPVGTASLTMLLEHSDDDVTFTNVALADVIGPTAVTAGIVLTTTGDQQILDVGYIGDKRYLRVSLIPLGLTNGGPVAAWVTKGHPRHAPK